MRPEANPIADFSSEPSSPTVEDLISHLRSSFYQQEFDYVAKTLTQREQRMNENYLDLKSAATEENDLLASENLKLHDDLKKKQDEIDALKKLNTEHERKFRVYEKRILESLELQAKAEARVKENLKLNDEIDDMRKVIAEYEAKFRVLSLEKVAKESMGSSINLEKSYRPPLFSEKNDSETKTEPKLPEIINIDDDDDDQGKRGSNEIKREYDSEEDDDDEDPVFLSKRMRLLKKIKRKHHGESAKISPVLKKRKLELDSSEPDSDSDSDTAQIDNIYMLSIAKMKKQKEGWKYESDMVKDFEKDDELCLNGVCALHRQRTTLHRVDVLRMSNLARMLIDGDKQKKLKKKALDLDRFDLDQCRMFVKKYSSRLFKIYLNKSDPFFPTSKGQEKSEMID